MTTCPAAAPLSATDSRKDRTVTISKPISSLLTASLVCISAKGAYAEPGNRPESNSAVSTAAQNRIAADIIDPAKNTLKAEKPHPAYNPARSPGPAALIAFGVTLLTAPISFGGGFSR